MVRPVPEPPAQGYTAGRTHGQSNIFPAFIPTKLVDGNEDGFITLGQASRRQVLEAITILRTTISSTTDRIRMLKRYAKLVV